MRDHARFARSLAQLESLRAAVMQSSLQHGKRRLDIEKRQRELFGPGSWGARPKDKLWVIRVVDEPWRVVGHVRKPPKLDVASTNESFVDLRQMAHG
jgi:hypothetical protein